MDMIRGFVGFVMGLVVMGGLYFGGALDSTAHWWARNVTHRGDNRYDPDPEHARYSISAIYQPAGSGGDNCEPRYEFINHTTRTVKFLPDGFDDSSYGNPNGYVPQTPGSNYVSTTPDQSTYGPPTSANTQQAYGSQNYGSSNYDQSYGPSNGSYGGQDYGNQDYSYGGGDEGGDQYGDDDYPGEYGNDGGCNAGTVQIILDKRQ